MKQDYNIKMQLLSAIPIFKKRLSIKVLKKKKN